MYIYDHICMYMYLYICICICILYVYVYMNSGSTGKYQVVGTSQTTSSWNNHVVDIAIVCPEVEKMSCI